MTRRLRAFALALPLALLAACASSPSPRYYTLGHGNAPVPMAPASVDAPTVWVAPVTIPEAVDRPQMVVRVAPNRVAIADLHRWAEPLGGAIARAVATDLSILLGGARVSADAQHAATGAQVRVFLDIQRFESVPGQEVAIEALWSVRRGADVEPKRGRSLVREAVTGADYDSLAAAHTRALLTLSREIAQAIRGH